MKKKEHLLLDMDNTLYDFQAEMEKQFHDKYRTLSFAHEIRILPRSQRTKYEFRELFTEDTSLWPALEKFSKGLYQNMDFFKNLQLIDGAKEAFEELSHYYTLQICSTASELNIGSEQGKRFTLERDFGYNIARKANFTADKTGARGHKLIDDNPTIDQGDFIPEREHIFYKQPYNKDIIGKRMLDWKNYRDILLNGM